ncbi:MAG TPA: hypothetical protein PK987_09340 [Ferruginibacter sp.]|nr:hypothetical protein [Ferruginibacter sp.]
MSTIISAIIIIAVLVLIFWLLLLIHKNSLQRKAAGLLIHFNEVAYNNNLVVTETELLHNMMFGYDKLYGKFLILETTGKNKYQHQVIDLDEVTDCTLQKIKRPVFDKGKPGKISEVILEQVNLLFEFTNKRKPVELVFYRNVVDYIFELQPLEAKAIKWQELISKQIKKQLRHIA